MEWRTSSASGSGAGRGRGGGKLFDRPHLRQDFVALVGLFSSRAREVRLDIFITVASPPRNAGHDYRKRLSRFLQDSTRKLVLRALRSAAKGIAPFELRHQFGNSFI